MQSHQQNQVIFQRIFKLCEFWSELSSDHLPSLRFSCDFNRLMRDNSITSLSGFAFPDKLQSLDLSDNTKLTTLRGAVLPASLQSLYVCLRIITTVVNLFMGVCVLRMRSECSDCAITIVQGMILPLRLTKMYVCDSSWQVESAQV